MKKVLFIDRDGTLVLEPPVDYQLDSLEKLEFFPGVFQWMSKISKLGYELVMVTNQDGLGTSSFPEDTFWPAHNKIIKAFENEGVVFDAIKIDPSFPEDNSPNRKPGTGMLAEYMTDGYDMGNSFVIGDRLTDVELAKNLGAKAIFITQNNDAGNDELTQDKKQLKTAMVLETDNWADIYSLLNKSSRQASVKKNH